MSLPRSGTKRRKKRWKLIAILFLVSRSASRQTLLTRVSHFLRIPFCLKGSSVICLIFCSLPLVCISLYPNAQLNCHTRLLTFVRVCIALASQPPLNLHALYSTCIRMLLSGRSTSPFHASLSLCVGSLNLMILFSFSLFFLHAAVRACYITQSFPVLPMALLIPHPACTVYASSTHHYIAHGSQLTAHTRYHIRSTRSIVLQVAPRRRRTPLRSVRHRTAAAFSWRTMPSPQSV